MPEAMTKSYNNEEKIHQAILDAAPDAVIVVNTHGKIVMCNDQVTRLFGYQKVDLLGEQIEVLIPNRYKEKHRSERIVYSNHPKVRGMGERQELLAKRKDGTEFYAEISLSPVTFSQEVLIISSIRDVTEKIELNHKLSESLHNLEIKNSELERLTYIVSHDLKSPLNTIIGLVQLLKASTLSEINEENVSILNMMEQSTQRLMALIVDLLDYALVGTKREKEVIDSNSLVRDLLTDLSQVISKNQALVTIDELPTLTGYRTELRQLFQNLIVNALKFQKPGNSPIVKVSCRIQNNDWHFSIQDNGIGIEKAHHNKIFETFQRLHSRNEYDGTGIGLATCMKIVKLHNGEIWVESEQGKGSVFHFTLSKSL